MVNSKFRYWLEIPLSLKLDIISLSHKKYGLNNQKSSTKFKQSQVSFRLCLRNSKTPTCGNCSKKLAKQLTIQKYLESNKNCKIIYQTSNWKWPNNSKTCHKTNLGLRKQSIQRILEKNYQQATKNSYNFVNRYLNNILANPTNWFLWKITSSALLSNFYHTRQTLLSRSRCKQLFNFLTRMHIYLET